MSKKIKKYSITTHQIWKSLMCGMSASDIISSNPVELEVWIRNHILQIKYNFFSFNDYCHSMEQYIKLSDTNNLNPTKKFVEERLDMYHEKYLHPIVLAIYDGKKDEVQKLIWKNIKPKFDIITIKKIDDEET